MVWGFLKSKISGLRPKPEKPKAVKTQEKKEEIKAVTEETSPDEKNAAEAKSTEKPSWEKSDEELAAEINAISPEILTQAKTPQMRKIILDVYRNMLRDGVNVKNDREVKKWMKKHPEAMRGGEVQKVETFKREQPKIGRNEPCFCGSGKKYKKCCGSKG